MNELTIRYVEGSTRTVACDQYRIQGNVILLEEKEKFDGQVLRTDEKFTTFMIISLSNVLDCEIEIEEAVKA